jgi:hypothetical protein
MDILGGGFIPQRWQNNVGSVLIVRQDKKPLLPEHGAALAEYCLSVIPADQVLYKDNNSNDTAERAAAVAKISRGGFVTNWCVLVHQKQLAVCSPYLYMTRT